jgi:S-DNA-T family DNA segregation ATPase FtsK/SpoIIIE
VTHPSADYFRAMSSHHQLLGRVAAWYLRDQLHAIGTSSGTGTARFIVDCLTSEQTAAIAWTILAEADLRSAFVIRLPASVMRPFGLPSDTLTNERATYYRNWVTASPAILLANVGDDEEQSLRELTPVGKSELMKRPDLWVSAASQNLALPAEHRPWWEAALYALQSLDIASLEAFATYVAATSAAIEEEGLPVSNALGHALPALRLPRDYDFFEAIPNNRRDIAAQWRALYATAHAKRACYLSKVRPTGVVLTNDELKDAYRRVQESIPDEARPAVEAFVSAPHGWSAESQEIAECEWEDVQPLFDGIRRVRANLGQLTLDFYNDRDPLDLPDEDRAYLGRLIDRRVTRAELPEDTAFYEAHVNELREDRKLKAMWDRFMFGAPIETTDFLVGLLRCLERFSWNTSVEDRSLTLRCDRRYPKDFESLNYHAGLYFAHRYRGLQSLFGDRVHWEVGRLFDFPAVVEQWQERGEDLEESETRSALEIKFFVELSIGSGRSSDRHQEQFIWKYEPNGVPSELPHDWDRLSTHPLVNRHVDREPASSKGLSQTLNLSDARTLIAASGEDRGSLIGDYDAKDDLAASWAQWLAEARQHGLLTTIGADQIRDRYSAFADRYTAAIRRFADQGLGDASLEEQAHAYGALLDALSRYGKGDRNRQLFLRPVLRLGTVAVEGGKPAVIVAPWHPLRLVAMQRKAKRIAAVLEQLLTTTSIEFGDQQLFFRDLQAELEHPWYPETAIGWSGDSPALLATMDVVNDYSLHEPPIASHSGLDLTGEDPAEGATRVVELVKRYVALQPHERANLSVVLYNCDSARLPMAVVDKLAAMQDDDAAMRCQVLLRHRDQSQLRNLYEQIVDAADIDGDAVVASETTRDFMARLRIGIMADQAPRSIGGDGTPNDLVFSQDVIARHAILEWYTQDATPADPYALNPAQWSRRRPAPAGQLKSVVFLCCPAQPPEGWAYATALATFFTRDWTDDEAQRLLPARQLDYQAPTTSRILEETHDLGAWVANYDELLDRRQLVECGVRVIRYKQSQTQGRNLVVSSTAPTTLLQSMVLGRLRQLDVGIDETALVDLAQRLIDDANDLSGDIVLRAAKRGRNANELIGIVLSRYLIRYELGLDAYAGWYFLDDYAGWLGQREQHIADLLALSPSSTGDGTLRLNVIVTEAKYIDAASLTVKSRESQRQLRDTVRRIGSAVAAHEARLDRDIWRERLSELLVDGVRFSADAPLDLPTWRRAIRDGRCEIALRGYSHVFLSGPSDDAGATGCISLSDPATASSEMWQETFARPELKELIRRYHAREDPTSVRCDRVDLAAGGGSGPTTPGFTPSKPSDGTELPSAASSATDDKPGPSEPGPAAAASGSRDAEPVVPSQPTESEPAGTGRWAYRDVERWVNRSAAATQDRSADEAWLRRVEVAVRTALQTFQLQAKLIQSTLTPNAALLKFQGSANLTVEQVLRRRSEFLTTHGLNIVAVQPEPGAVTLSIARPTREVVSLRQVWQRWIPDSQAGNEDLLIGVRETDGRLLVLSPGGQHAPHTMIAGSTGSGKSVLMQNMLLSIAATNTPAQAQIVLIDPKQGVDYFAFEQLPHLDGQIIDQPQDALERINALVSEMDSRYAKLRSARAPNLRTYNSRALEHERLPILWLIHDEFAEWMLVEEYKQSVTAAVSRLGVKARAAGIHLIFAAQRPDANVVPVQLRANLGNRLILRVDSEGTSEIALGEKGAERLLGRGHMVAKLEGEPSLVYAQVPYIEPSDIDELIRSMLST